MDRPLRSTVALLLALVLLGGTLAAVHNDASVAHFFVHCEEEKEAFRVDFPWSLDSPDAALSS